MDFNRLNVLHGYSLVSARTHTTGWTVSEVILQSLTLYKAFFDRGRVKRCRQLCSCLTLILLMWRIWWAPYNASTWQLGFNSAFKGLMLLGGKEDVTRRRGRRRKHLLNSLTPNDLYMSRNAPLTSKRCILYIYSTNVGTEYFKYALYSPFFLFKMQFVS